MAAGKIKLQKASGGVTSITGVDGVGDTSLVIPESGNVASVDTAVTDNAIARFDGTTGKLQNSSVTIDDNGNIGSGAQTFNGFGGSGFKNYIINGNFDIWQRGTSQTTSGYGSADRWGFINNGTSSRTVYKTIATDTDRTYFTSSGILSVTLTSLDTINSGRGIRHVQPVEDVTRLAGKTVTLSFWAKATNNTEIETTFQQVFGTGGSPSSAVISNAKRFSLSTQWTKFTTTVNIPSIIGKTLGTDGVHTSLTNVKFHLMSDSVNALSEGLTGDLTPTVGTILYFAQVQLEEGSVPTPFEVRPYGLELSLCQRYYETGYFAVTAGTVGTGIVLTTNIVYKNTKRISATVAYSGVTYTNCSNIATNLNTITQVTPQLNISLGGYAYATGIYTASAEL